MIPWMEVAGIIILATLGALAGRCFWNVQKQTLDPDTIVTATLPG